MSNYFPNFITKNEIIIIINTQFVYLTHNFIFIYYTKFINIYWYLNMSNSILELIRSKHEDIEHLEKALAKAISFKENNVYIFNLA